MKQRMASADVAGEVACLKQKIIGLRLANLYDLNAKTYVLKLAKSGSDGEKVFLLLESGTRFHTVQVMHNKPDAPSNFTLKLRKHLRTRRLEDVRQLGVDRVVDFVFGCGENAHHLILEMYAQGNVILTDHNYQILTLLRSHRDDDKGRSTMARHPYPMHAIRLRQPLALTTLRAALQEAAAASAGAGGGDSAAAAAAAAAAAGGGAKQQQGAGGDEEDEGQSGSDDGDDAAPQQQQQQANGHKANGAAAGGQGSKKQAAAAKGGGGWKAAAAAATGPVLKTLVADLVPYGPAIAEHCCLSAGLQPQHPLASQPLTEAQVSALHAAVQAFEAWLAGLDAGAEAEGFIAAVQTAASKAAAAAAAQQQGTEGKEGKEGAAAAAAAASAGLVYHEYNPLRLQAVKGGGEVLRFATFDEALDEYYGKIQGQRVEVAKLDAERAALSRLDKIKIDQGARAEALMREAAASEERASLIEYNLEAVDGAIDAVNAAIATGMDWRELEALIREERRSGNPVAGAIHSLQLDQNKITLLLSNLLDTEEDDEAALTRPATKVQVELSMSAYSNAAAHHAARKKQQVKQEKTLAAHAEAFKAAEKKAAAQLANLRTSGPATTVLRKAAWYERFHWFISAENYLVISGHDAQQNEIIVKRYFRKEDVYVHAELHGASSTIIRNHDPSRPVPPLTLQQAGCACVCRSKAWDAKLVTSAWWVHHHQVSKTAPTGEYLPTGSFMVRGKKNFLPPQGLVMGLAFMFKLEDSCIGRHAGERAVRGGLDGEEEEEEGQQRQQRSAAAGGSGSDDDDEEEGDSQAGSSSHVLSAAASSATSALDAFLDMSADSLAAAAAAAGGGGAATGAAGAGGLRHSGSGSAAGGGSFSSSSRAAGYERYGLEHPAAAADAEEGEEGEEGQPGGSKQQGESKRYVTAAERARLKKAAKGGSGSSSSLTQQPPPQQPQAKQPQQPKQQQPQASKGGKQQGGGGGKPPAGPSAASAAAAAAAAAAASKVASSRGKKGKAAKAKEKYAEQDEEDRELALQLLASSGAQKSRQDRRQARKAAREEARQARDAGLGAAAGGPPGSSRADIIKRATGSQFADVHSSQAAAAAAAAADGDGSSSSSGGSEAGAAEQPAPPSTQQQQDQQQPKKQRQPSQGHSSSSSAASSRTKAAAAAAEPNDDSDDGGDDGDAAAKELAAAADEAERAEISALLAEENVAELPYEEGDAAAAQALKELDSLTGCPRPDDVLLYAVPVCGPYAALANYKFKVKLTPGTLKKGKAAKQALELLVRSTDVLQRERDLMRAVPDAELVACMVGTVKISASGLQQMKAASKKARKAAAQSRAR